MKYIKGFDGLRGISIFLVLLTHLAFLDNLDFNNYWVKRLLKMISGHTGVVIFFTLSGFLISKILIQEKIKNGFINLKAFFIKRFLRLAPALVIFYIIIFTFMILKMISVSYQGLVFVFFYLYNFLPSKYYTSELGHLWSLAVEEQFYFIWPFIINLFNRYAKMLMLITILVLCVISQAVLPNLFLPFNGKSYFISEVFRVNGWFFPAAFPIIIGSASYSLFNGGDFSGSGLSSPHGYGRIGILLFFSPFLIPDFALDYSYMIQAIGISLILNWIVNNQDSIIVKALDFQQLAYVGKISYGLYVYHGFFIRTGPGGGLSIQQFPINIILTFIVSIISFEFYEKRVLRLKSKLQ